MSKSGLELTRESVLARVPKGFERAPVAVAEALKLKWWIVERKLSPAEIGTAKLVDAVVKLAADAAPLLQFGWGALD